MTVAGARPTQTVATTSSGDEEISSAMSPATRQQLIAERAELGPEPAGRLGIAASG